MTTGALEGLLYCGNILIPSLFPFAVFAALAVKSGFANWLGKWLNPVTKRLFHLDGTAGTVILLGLTGGFPIGAKGVSELYKQGGISKETAQTMTMFLVGGGPGFIVAVVGVSFFHDIVTGLMLWVCQIAAQILMGIFLCRKLSFSVSHKEKIRHTSLSVCIVQSVQSGVESMLSLCGMVILFSCVFGILDGLRILNMTAVLLENLSVPVGISQSIMGVLWEVTKGCNLCFNNAVPLWLMSFALGWGGLCVHFQIYALTVDLQIPKLKFMLCRFLQGLISAGMTVWIFRLYQPVADVYGNFGKNVVLTSTPTAAGSVAMIGMCILFMLTLLKKPS